MPWKGDRINLPVGLSGKQCLFKAIRTVHSIPPVARPDAKPVGRERTLVCSVGFPVREGTVKLILIHEHQIPNS